MIRKKIVKNLLVGACSIMVLGAISGITYKLVKDNTDLKFVDSLDEIDIKAVKGDDTKLSLTSTAKNLLSLRECSVRDYIYKMYDDVNSTLRKHDNNEVKELEVVSILKNSDGKKAIVNYHFEFNDDDKLSDYSINIQIKNETIVLYGNGSVESVSLASDKYKNTWDSYIYVLTTDGYYLDEFNFYENKKLSDMLFNEFLEFEKIKSSEQAPSNAVSHLMTFENGITDSTGFYTINGTVATGTSITYDNKTLTSYLKMESSTSIKFSISAKKKLTIVGGPSASPMSVNINGTSHSLTSNVSGYSILSLDIEPGDYEITKNTSSTFIYYVLVE